MSSLTKTSSSVTTSSATVYFTAVTDSGSNLNYRVRCQIGTMTGNSTTWTGDASTSKSCTVSGLSAGTTYTCNAWIQYKQTYESSWSNSTVYCNSFSITTKAESVTGTVTASSATSVGFTYSVRLSTSNASSVYMYNHTTGAWTRINYSSYQTSYSATKTNCDAGTTYTLYLYNTTDDSGNILDSYTITTKEETVTGTITASNATDTTAYISITRSTSGAWSVYRGSTRINYGSSGTSSSWTTTGLSPGTNYTFYLYDSTTSSGNLLDSDSITTKSTYTISTSVSPSGSGSVSGAGTYVYGDTCTLTATPASGYAFSSWYKGSTYIGTSNPLSVTVTGAATYTANFTQTVFTLSYNANGGTSTPSSSSVTTGNTITLASAISHNSEVSATYTTTFNRMGGGDTTTSTSYRYLNYSFSTWKDSYYGNNYSASGSYTMPSSDVVMTAQWSNSSSYSSITLPSATKAYNTFKGWYTASEGGTRIGGAGDTYTPTSTQTLYAQWTHDSISLFYWLGSEAADNNSTTGIVAGCPSTNMTATAWKSIGTKIIELQTALGDTPSTFTTTMKSGDALLSSYCNEVISALNTIKTLHSLSIDIPSTTHSGDVAYHTLFNGTGSMKQSLNNMIQWYNTR